MTLKSVRRPAGTPEKPVRSVRVANGDWERAKRRAALEGTTMSNVLEAFTVGYAKGLVNAPRVQVVYDTEPVAVGE